MNVLTAEESYLLLLLYIIANLFKDIPQFYFFFLLETVKSFLFFLDEFIMALLQ